MEKPENCIIVIFGASGDLTKRKLMPSLFELFQKKLLPSNFAILGIGRTEFNDYSFRDKVSDSMRVFVKKRPYDKRSFAAFLRRIYYHVMDSSDAEAYAGLKNKLLELDELVKSNGSYIYYLATSPALYQVITQNLEPEELHKQGNGVGWKRIVFEKPFGYDFVSAKALNKSVQKVFTEDQIYRIDHYLGKETVQNIMAFRFANGIFEPLWNRNYIHHIEVTAAENLGVENRGEYYDSAGALRDMVQNHLLQVLATVAMEPPSKFTSKALRNEKVKVFQSLCPIAPEKVSQQVIRGQYVESTLRGDKLTAYRKEKKVAKDSKTETYIAMKVYVDNWRWGGVPFYIRTGKRMPTRITEVVIHFKKTPHLLFTREYTSRISDNQLIIRLQPDEGILLKFGLKVPGAGFRIRTVDMDFHYKDLGDNNLPDAYERLLLDCMLGDTSLYARSDAVEACWEFVTPILKAWQQNPDIKLYGYPAGTWGPKEVTELIEQADEDWHYPSKELVQNGEYYEL